MTATHTISLGPLSLLATQSGPILTITIHAPSDSAPVGRMTLTVPEWTALVALVDCMALADRDSLRQHVRELTEENERLLALTLNPGATIHGSTITEVVKERDEYHEMLRAILAACDDSTRASIGKDAPLRAVRKVVSDLSAALVSVDAMAGRIEQMRPVYERAVVLSELRAKQRSLDDMNYDQMDGQIVDAMDAIDTALAHTASEQGKESK